jgi:hypothetical protein
VPCLGIWKIEDDAFNGPSTSRKTRRRRRIWVSSSSQIPKRNVFLQVISPWGVTSTDDHWTTRRRVDLEILNMLIIRFIFV